MRWTNRFQIDPAIAKVIMEDPYEKRGDISVTGLIRPPQIAGLEAEHEDELVEDVSDGMWRLLGRAVHSVLADAQVLGALQEHQLMTRILDWDVSGTFDTYYDDGYVLKDYKVSTVYAYIYGKAEWEYQVNMYVYMARLVGIRVDRAGVSLLMRDWHEGEARLRDGYPPRPFMEIDIPIWTAKKTEHYMEERVKLHQAARRGQYAECSIEERWARPTTYAVMKPGAKRAGRGMVSKTYAEAEGKMKPGYEIVTRPGSNIRCERFCPVRRWCAQADRLGVPFVSRPGGVMLNEAGIPVQ